jgi:ABC-type nitrate/sulfonate/bicarbonate transport system substrate-binding protein
MASIASTDRLIKSSPDVAAFAVRAIVKAHAALKQNINNATEVGRRLFPPSEANLIADLVRRDLPYYDASISEAAVCGLNRFARDLGILNREVAYENVVATQFCHLWKA